MNNCATILLTYRRPKHTAVVLDALRRDKVQNILFFSDAPAKPEHKAEVDATRALATGIDWTTPTLIFREQNFGLARSVVDAVRVAFEAYDEVIVLEDDCVPGPHFFRLAYECLRRFQNDFEVYGFSGSVPEISESILAKYPYDVCFLPRSSSWGWATWKNRWIERIPELPAAIRACLEKGVSLATCGEDVLCYAHMILTGRLHDSWTIPWALTVNSKKAVFAFPTRSQIDNIGFDGSGIHCGEAKSQSVVKHFASDELRIPKFQFIDPEIYRETRKQFRQDYPVTTQDVQAIVQTIVPRTPQTGSAHA